MNQYLKATSAIDDSSRVVFSGTSGEYFGIWITNIILSVLTLGVYSAWAKVRRVTYFNNNTRVLDYGFGYHATGRQILIGRLAALFFLIISSVIINFSPIFIAIWLFLIPWLFNSSMRFSARMTSYRNVRFGWHGEYWRSFWFFVIAPIFGILTLGILIPLITKHIYRYYVTYHSFGTTRFKAELDTKRFYMSSFKMFFIMLLLSIFVTIIMRFLEISMGDFLVGRDREAVFALGQLIVGIYVVRVVWWALCRNLMMRGLILSDVAKFDSEINSLQYIWIKFSNFLAIVFSLGLLLPWAKIREYAYLSRCTGVNITGDIEKFVSDTSSSQESPFGEELATFEGVEMNV